MNNKVWQGVDCLEDEMFGGVNVKGGRVKTLGCLGLMRGTITGGVKS